MTTSSLNELRKRVGSDLRTVKKYLEQEGIKPDRKGRYETAAALACIERHKPQPNGEEIDPETGLSWFQAKVREDTKKLRRENEIADRLKDETYMETATVQHLVQMFIGKLELIPVKMESEFSLPQEAVKRLTEYLDEARREMAKGVLKG